MKVVFQIQGIEFEWDEEKYAQNLQEHRIKFGTAAEAFFDPFYKIGTTLIAEEKIDFIIGYSFSQILLLVIFVQSHKKTRIISARQATVAEKELYEKY